jgi:hypothetical protein
MKHKRRTSRRRQIVSVPSEDNHWQALCIDADFEPVTHAGYSHRFSYLYPKLKNMNIDLVFCSGPDDTRLNVASHAAVPTVAYVTGEGHGGPASYQGQDYGLIFAVGGYQASEVRGKIAHFLSCRTAIQLGQDMVAKGCRAFFGYDFDFSYHPDFADVSLTCDSEIDLGFADRMTAAQVYARVKDRFVKTAADLRAIGGDPANRAAAAVETNFSHLVCPTSGGPKWGDESAKVW